MPSSRIPSPARSQGVISTPRKHTPRRSRSVCSARSNMSMRLTAVISDSFKLSPMPNRKSVLNDDTDIEIPGRKSWWKKLGENSRDVMEVLESKDIAVVNNVAEEFDVEILSQEKKNYTLDLPESSDGESINSIVIPQRKLFTQKENQAQKKFGHLIDNRETLAKLQKSHFDQEKDIDVGPKNLFSQASKPRTKPAFPAALLNISSKSVNKTKEMPAAEVKGQVRNLFGNRPGMKRKNMFADFIVSESEDEIPDIQPKVFGFQKNTQKRRDSTASRGVGHSPTSSIDLELDEWKFLPSSTMVENQLEEATTPVKRARLSKLVETKESETTNVNSTVNKTKQSNKSVSSKNKSKTASNSKMKENIEKDLNPASKTKDDLLANQINQSLNSSSVRLTRNKSKSLRESSLKEGDSKVHNKSKINSQSKQNISVKALVHASDKNTKQDTEKNTETNLIQNEDEIQNLSTEQVPGDDDEDFTLEYENDDEQIIEPITTNINNDKNKSPPSKSNNDTNITTSKVHHVENKCRENNDLLESSIDTGINIIDKNNKEVSPKQKGRDEQDGAGVQIEKQAHHNKQQNLHKSLIKDSDKSKQQEEINQSHSAGIQKEKNVTNVKDIQQTAHAQLEKSNIHKIDSQHLDEIVNKEIENEEQYENKNINDDIEMSNKTSQLSNNVQNDQNKSIHEASLEVEQGDYGHSQNETETNETENDEEQTDQDEIEHETEDQTDQNESENNSDAEEQIESSKDETENQENESIEENEEENEDEENEIENPDETKDEIDEESEVKNPSKSKDEIDEESEIENQYASDNEDEVNEENETENREESENDEVDESNEIENQTESEKADSEDSIQNDSNLSLNENEQEDEVIESEQEQSDNDNDDNEVPENIVADNTNDHDTTGRHRKKDVTVKSPEAILHDKTNQIESFMAQGRNTSVRKTKSIIKNLNIRPSLAPVRESTGLTDGTRDSSAEGSGWDSHRTTRKTIRLTLGKDFTPRKSLRALVMEKSAKRNTNFNEVVADITKVPQANSTELPAFDSYHEPEPVQVDETDETVDEPSEHEVSARTRQTTLEMYLQKVKHENLERKRKMEEEIRASLKAPTRDTFNSFKVPLKPVRRIKPVQTKPKTKQIKSSVIPLDMLPSEVLEDMKYKPPKRFQPSNASWITKRLYKFLESKLEPKYDYKARVRAERLVELIYGVTRSLRRAPSELAVDTLKKEMARLDVVKTHFDFYQFFHEFMPREIRVKVVPDVVNKISLPRNGVFSDIIT